MWKTLKKYKKYWFISRNQAENLITSKLLSLIIVTLNLLKHELKQKDCWQDFKGLLGDSNI